MRISGMAKVFGVIGHPVGHSLSPVMHNAAIESLDLDYVYVPFDVPPEKLEAAIEGIRALGIAGVNITVPHKEAVIPFLDELEQEASEIGSVNTVTNLNGKLIGQSTDGPGFIRSLAESGCYPRGRNAVVLGAGGAGRAITFSLVRNGAKVALFDMDVKRAMQLVDDINVKCTECEVGSVHLVHSQESELEAAVASADILVKCTPVGMHPNVDKIPIPPEWLRRDHIVFDLVYNPIRTKILKAAESAGALAISGVKMLVYQGALSFRTWTGIDPPVDIMEDAVIAYL